MIIHAKIKFGAFLNELQKQGVEIQQGTQTITLVYKGKTFRITKSVNDYVSLKIQLAILEGLSLGR